jgi:CAAX protease family protein
MTLANAWIAYLLATLVAEAALPFSPVATAIIDAAVLVLALSDFGWAQRSPLAIGDPPTRLIPAVALIPLLRLLSLTVPVPEWPQELWLALAGAPLLVAVAAAARLTNMDVVEMGLARISRSWRSGVVVAVGLPAGLLVGSLQASPLGSGGSPAAAFAIAVIGVGLAAIPEELIFRGVLQPLMVAAIGRFGIIVGAIAFGLTYAGTGSPGVVAVMVAIGLVFGWEVAETNSIWAPVLGHSLMIVTVIFIAPVLLAG